MKRAILALLCAACGGSTGSDLVVFQAQAAGPEGAAAPFAFDTGAGFHVSLARARLHIGAIYLNTTVPSSGGAATSCVSSSGFYVAQTFGPITVDLLSPSPQPFPGTGEGTETAARTAEVWLTGGDVNAPVDPTAILDVAGTATRGTDTWPFTGIITISSNRAVPVANPTLPGSNPICKQRIVTPILINLTPTNGGVLTIRIDPRGIFQAVDFTSLGASGAIAPLTIPDTQAGAGQALFKGLLSNAGVYQFNWEGAVQ
jgi:hypothetical protein